MFESNIFKNRTDHEHFLMRAMIGGTHHLETKYSSETDLIKLAKEEVRSTLGVSQDPVQTILKVWPQAIPQYDTAYSEAVPFIQRELDQDKSLSIVANYWNGVSVNDCILNARLAAERSHL